MTRTGYSWPFLGLALVECATILLSFAVSYWLLYGGIAAALRDFAPYSLLLVCAILELMMLAVGLYNWNLIKGGTELLIRLLAAFGLGYVLYALLVYLFDSLTLPAFVLTVAFGLAMPLVFAVRLFFMKLMNLSQLKTRVLVLGTGKQAARIAALEQRGQASRFVVHRFVDLEQGAAKVARDRIMEMPNDLADYAEANQIEEIVVALEERRGQMPLDAMINSRLRGVAVSDYQGFCERAEGRIDIEALHPSWFFQSGGFRSSLFDRFFKRSFDIVLSLLLLFFTLPVLILTAILIRIESPGPVFYRQERVGLGGRPFVLIKFRSMRNDAEKGGKAQWAQKNDPRVTRVGSVIRKTRIDEIPQVLNVLKGDMSFVGPRPERPQFVERLAHEIPFYQERHSVRPGITGWAQLNYPYGASVEDAKQKLQYDLFYIKYFSVVFDLSIALQTLRVVIWPDGAR